MAQPRHAAGSPSATAEVLSHIASPTRVPQKPAPGPRLSAHPVHQAKRDKKQSGAGKEEAEKKKQVKAPKINRQRRQETGPGTRERKTSHRRHLGMTPATPSPVHTGGAPSCCRCPLLFPNPQQGPGQGHPWEMGAAEPLGAGALEPSSWRQKQQKHELRAGEWLASAAGTRHPPTRPLPLRRRTRGLQPPPCSPQKGSPALLGAPSDTPSAAGSRGGDASAPRAAPGHDPQPGARGGWVLGTR